ncbi:MAG TPA: hypothetical protein VMW27_29395 [Thermoanaerobaculia bacterium]|nr:hypothetical protein [Thermoanaerobaculia bacterium]
MSKIRSFVWGAMALALLAGSPLLAVDVIQKGVDAWVTVQGFTQTSFESDPIPAGFFCAGSQPFNGKVVFRGAPLASQPADALGGPVDTVVSRLDDAVFNDKGEASTRIQLKALSLASTKPVETSCGQYNVAVSLAGEQPKTTMKIVRTEENGGRYEAPLALNVKMTFTPVDGKGAQRELTREVRLGPGSHSVWSYADKPRYAGPIFIDTDGDGKPDTQVRGSRFIAGQAPVPGAVSFASWTTYSTQPSCPTGTCPKQSCHCNPNEDSWDPNEDGDGCSNTHLHCIWVCVPASSGTGGTGGGTNPGTGTLGSGTFNGTEPTPDPSYNCASISTID